MAFLTYNNPPTDLRDPTLLFAFAGWADAADSATHALRYVVRHLKGEKFAEVDPEEFYNFTRVRPKTKFDDDGERYIEWPANEFFAIRREDADTDLLVLVGVEPNVKWRTFCQEMLEQIQSLGVTKVIQVGALLDAVPHTRDVRITGTATSPELRGMLKGIHVRRSRYTGPTGIAGVMTDVLRRAGIPTVSLWGHAPHYLQVTPNPKVSLGLVQGLEQLIDISVPDEALRSQGLNFERRVEQALDGESDVMAYVEKLEVQWDARRSERASESSADSAPESTDGPEPAGSGAEPGDIPDADQAVASIEEFLRQERQGDGGSEGSQD
jgi:proteasome assembly chaperone (PAC2) family protein